MSESEQLVDRFLIEALQSISCSDIIDLKIERAGESLRKSAATLDMIEAFQQRWAETRLQ